MISFFIKYNIKGLSRNINQIVSPLLFFIIVMVFFPLSLGQNTHLLSVISVPIYWIVAMLSSLLSLDRIFKDDYDDGTLEQLYISTHSFYFIILSKILIHWVVSFLPIIIISPLMSIFLSMEYDKLIIMVIALLLGTPILSIIGSIGSALTLSLNKNGLLISIITLPLYIPVLIWGSGISNLYQNNQPVDGAFAILVLLLFISVIFVPFAISAALKIHISDSR